MALTRILNVTAKLGEPVIDFGNVEVGEEGYGEFLICNVGTEGIAVEATSEPDGFWTYLDNWEYWESGRLVAPGECLDGSVGFTPVRIGRYEGSLVVKGNHTAGTDTIRVQGTGMAPTRPPLRVFGDGLYIVGLVVAPGRYYAEPGGECRWSRYSRYPARSETDFIVVGAPWFAPTHWIVDLPPSDMAFHSQGCGWWGWIPGNAPSTGTIPHGVWEVNRQIQPGRYATLSQAGCRWERLRHFEWTPEGVLEQQQTSTGGAIAVEILRSDAGFLSSPECGVWTRIQ